MLILKIPLLLFILRMITQEYFSWVTRYIGCRQSLSPLAKQIRHILSKDYYVSLRMCVTHPFTTNCYCKNDDVDIQIQ